MAKAKTKAETEAVEVTEEVEVKKEEVKKDSKAFWSELVPFRAFKDDDKYKDDIFVAVNGRTYLIKRGEEVMIPRNVYEVLKQADEQRKAAAHYQESMQDEYRVASKHF